MPVYSYKCNDCGANTEIKATVAEKVAHSPEQFLCSACGSTDVKQEFDLVTMLNKAGQPSGPFCSVDYGSDKGGSSDGSGCAPGGGCCG